MINEIGANVCRYIWRNIESFNNSLFSDRGEPVTLIRTGELDESSGYYIGAQILIGEDRYIADTIMHNSVSGFERWQRSVDARERRGSIHVISIDENISIPAIYTPNDCIVLFMKAPNSLIRGYFAVSNSDNALCGAYFSQLNEISKIAILEGMFVRRLEKKSLHIEINHELCGGNWLNTLLFAIFDSISIASKNRKLFVSLLSHIGYYRVIQSLKSVEEVEALLMGCAGLLDEVSFADEYLYLQRRRFDKIQKDYGLKKMNGNYWDRSTYAGGVMILMAQLSAVIFYNKTLLYDIAESRNIASIYALLDKNVSEYWLSHDEFGVKEDSVYSSRAMSRTKANTVLINGILPFMMLYATKNSIADIDGGVILDYYNSLPSEENKYIRKWDKYGVAVENALESQAIIEITKSLCSSRLCYACPIGIKLLKNSR